MLDYFSRMKLTFFKYQGTGNDFVMLDNRQKFISQKGYQTGESLCDRKFGIGSDGLILLENDNSADFKMVYYNADGNESTMCGNGGRCLVAFAKQLGIIEKETTFTAIDGLHKAIIEDDLVTLWMTGVDTIESRADSFFLNTGSPHHVQLVEDLAALDVKNEGAKLRYGLYGAAGSNINFVKQLSDDSFKIRTYERGVEDETLSCGTGVTAVALAMHHSNKTSASVIQVAVEGGQLAVEFNEDAGIYSNIRLIGPAKFVFQGEITCNI